MATQRFIFAGGGTGGHLFPALAIADELKRINPGAEILFIGTKDKLEARVVPQHGYDFRSIWISGFQRRHLLKNILFPVKVITAVMQSRTIIKEFTPSVVIGTGGYVAGPALYAATMLNVPTVIHEQNSYPGVTTRMLSGRVNEVYVTYEESKKYLNNARHCVTTGNPTRSSLENVNRKEAFGYFGFTEDRQKTLFVFGGSLGAHSINQAVVKHLDALMQSNIRLIWQTGSQDYDTLQQAGAKYPPPSLHISAFIDRMDFAYALSDAVVCRSGATTLAEITRLGKPAVLIPYPHATDDHQTRNAQMLVQAGAAAIINDSEAGDMLFTILTKLINDDTALRGMSDASKKLGKPDAAHDIAERIIALAHKQKAAS